MKVSVLFSNNAEILDIYGVEKCIEILNGTHSVGQYSTTVNLGMLSAGEYIAILRKDDEFYSERTSVVK